MSRSRHYEEESHAIALARTRSRNRSVAAAEDAKKEPNSDVESVSEAAGIIEERDFKHKQVKQWSKLEQAD